MQVHKLMLIALNEINFDVANQYVQAQRDRFPALHRILSGPRVRTTAEKQYQELEPWIQWPSVHSGLSFAEHNVFRLGDMVGSSVPQMFEQLEAHGLRMGCISPMNAENRLHRAAYFVPDPWTNTPADSSWWSRVLSSAISQAVNDNAQARISARSALHLVLGLMRFAQPRNYALYWQLASQSRGASWRKALVLDLLLHDLHMHLFASKKPDFSTLFLNAGAHIQHHYFFNALPVKEQTALRNPAWYVSPQADPVAEMLTVYDRIVADYLDRPGVEVIFATGLSQRPFDRIKFYYRLKNHEAFLRILGIPFKHVQPRMTRDFLIGFDSPEQAYAAQKQLADIRIAGSKDHLFGEIDNRGDSLFVTLTYPHEIDQAVEIEHGGGTIPLSPHVAFVAVKNGMHQEDGFAFFTPGVASFAPKDGTHVKELYSTVMQFFGIADEVAND
jgi:hypothetical protein